MLPTLDEEKALENVYNRIPFEKLQSLGFDSKVVIVDGGSKDDTLLVAKNLGCTIISQWGKGKGVGIRQAFKKFIDEDDDVLVMLDSDGTYWPRNS